MEFTRCLRCMKETANYPCPHCGYDPRADKPKEYVLRPGTILNGKYVVGTPLGQGGFGITYIGWDLLLDNQVAIKEYFPSGQVGRSTTGALQWYSTPQAENARNSGKEMFLKEARKMSRVGSIPQVVHIRDLFQQNDTAYIVMDFVEGETLMDRLKKTGPLSWEDAKEIFFPAIRAMEQVHQAGLVHRDLSPDNLMLLPDGSVRILDLGAAKDLNINSGASSMQVAKGGFSPLEQYTQRGGSGTWSDVYAMAATMYYSLTGVLPPPVMDRMEDDQIRWALPGLTALSAPALEALKKAMVLLAKDRTQSMGEFLRQLEKAPAKQKPTSKPRKKLSPLPIIAAVLVVALVAVWGLWPKYVESPQTIADEESIFVAETSPKSDSTKPTMPEYVFPLSMTAQTISTGFTNTVAVHENGTVTTVGGSKLKQSEIQDWSNIVSVSTSDCHIVGLKEDGTVVATGENENGQCEVSEWQDIVAICAERSHTVGLKADGTVVVTKPTDSRTVYLHYDWHDIVAVSTADECTVVLQADGTVDTAGSAQYYLSDWRNITAISGGDNHVVGLTIYGSVVAEGDNSNGQCNVSRWKDIVAVSAGYCHTVGLKADGTVVAAGDNEKGQCDVSDWTDIVAISAGGRHTIGLKADGTLVTAGSNGGGQCNVSDWTDIRIPGAIS